MSDRLTRRERNLYRLFHGIGLAVSGAAFYWYFIGRISYPDAVQVVLLYVPVSLVVVFGLALKTDTRIIYSIRWLREDGDKQ